MNDTTESLPKSFKRRRLHSIMGLWLVVYLIIHLITNSQAALFVGEDGKGFVKAVNDIHNLPYLAIIEIVLLLIPFLIHIVWGIERLNMSRINSFKSDGSTPSLGEYPRNQAYTWQRITSWILLVLITAHVIQMKIIEQPVHGQIGTEEYYLDRLEGDLGLYTLGERLGFTIHDPAQVTKLIEEAKGKIHYPNQPLDTPEGALESQKIQEQEHWLLALSTWELKPGQVIAQTKNFGTAELLMVRETFKNPWMLILYTVLVVSACFHAFNGLWTFCITWGITLSPRSQNMMRVFSTGLMFLITFVGLAAIWGTYWINLKQ